jgi:ABC-2 type transport system permease protein
MKLIRVFTKSLKEQIRSFWMLLLSLSMGPFFILVYYLIIESSKVHYNILVASDDKGAVCLGNPVNHGNELLAFLMHTDADNPDIPFAVSEVRDRETGIAWLKNNKADVLIILEESFSAHFDTCRQKTGARPPGIEFIGDLTNTSYLIGAIWAGEMIQDYFREAMNSDEIVEIKEIALGSSASVSDFDMIVPGILIVSLIMLMFTASIAVVSEVENKTIIRLKLSRVKTLEFLGGVALVQLLVGISSVLLTLITALILGFHYSGSFIIMILIAGLTSLSIISFSLIIAALTKSANEVLVVGNFPMFLFMFFTGAAFPMKSQPMFTIAGYPIGIKGLMTPSHAISALNKTLVMNMDLGSILPEIFSILLLTVLYFLIGAVVFRHRHLRLM